MKINATGLYEICEDGFHIRDVETGKRMIFILDKTSNLVLRSMLEDDVRAVKAIMSGVSSDKRKKYRAIVNRIREQGSENELLVAEKIMHTGKEDLYEEEREIIGYGKLLKNDLSIEVAEHDKSLEVLNLLKKLAKHYGINGNGYLLHQKK